ncbi:unnamed protein product [Caenorhabditis bovis]|uniref:Serpin domain-containing protein n=1 Tax=Caenorhabditis bovis TaxID=2654633 RepID=A0A8S1EE78_9PELO|nr:unnamed protein product [Caenorhabditis bovis]
MVGGVGTNDTFVDSETALALSVLKQIPADESSVISPVSISLALALLHAGANGETKDQINKVLVNGGDDSDLKSNYGKLAAAAKNSENGVIVNIVNRLFTEEFANMNEKEIELKFFEVFSGNVSLNAKFIDDIRLNYQAGAQAVNFEEREQAAAAINDFADTTTSGKIKKLVSPDDMKDAIAFLVNAVYFQAEWLEKFDKNSSMELEFESNENSSRKIEFLNDYGVDRGYAENDLFQLLSLPYADTSFSFVIFLPKEKFALKAALDTDLKECLEAVGLTKVFSDDANFSNIASNAKITSGIHKAVIEVDEDGTTAAAASAFKASLECMQETIDFTANHPFLFALVKEKHIFFLGIHA